jgi:imidazole glycerol-phosphate synthase subunit HisH
MIAIIDLGNAGSVENAFRYLGIECKVTNDPQEVFTADKVVLPGVGSFGAVMKQLEKKGLDVVIKKMIEQGKKFLGICVGMQVLFEESEESIGVNGLAVLKGKVVKFRRGKVPQIGWNKINDEYMYFVNSYYVVPNDKEVIAGTTDYFVEFVSIVEFENVTAVQFHPEKSGKCGLDLLRRWAKC